MKTRFTSSLWLVATLSLVIAGCGGGGGGGGGSSPVSTPAATGTVAGQVADLGGTPIADAQVTTSAGTTQSGPDGSFSVAAAVGDRVVVHVEAQGYAETYPITSVTAGQTSTLGVRLLPVAVSQSLTVALGGTVSVPGSTAQVDFPAGSLVPESGAAAGTVTVSLTPINPADDPALMPGDFTGVSAGNVEEPIESFGALAIDIRDAGGTSYNLASGQSATIRIPLGTLSATPPPTIALYYFDESDGLWKEEGTATLMGVAPDQYYEGTVTHFSTWNADRKLDRVFVTGCVEDGNGNPVRGLTVLAKGIDYSGQASDVTDADGRFRVAIRLNSQAQLSVSTFFVETFSFTQITQSITVGPSPVDFDVPDCLVTQFAIVNKSPLKPAVTGNLYGVGLVASGGKSPLGWSVIAGALPDGLTLDAATGLIRGTPQVAGTYGFTVRVQDGSSPAQVAEKAFSITVHQGGGGQGSLLIDGAPPSLEGVFAGTAPVAPTDDDGDGTVAVVFLEQDLSNPSHAELLAASFDIVTGEVGLAILSFSNGSEGDAWICFDFTTFNCPSATADAQAGSITFNNTVMVDNTDEDAPPLAPITVNGTLFFTPVQAP